MENKIELIEDLDDELKYLKQLNASSECIEKATLRFKNLKVGNIIKQSDGTPSLALYEVTKIKNNKVYGFLKTDGPVIVDIYRN